RPGAAMAPGESLSSRARCAGTWTEDRGPNSNHRGTFQDGVLEVAAHAHRTHTQLQLVGERAQLGEIRTRIARRRWHGHQALHRETGGLCVRNELRRFARFAATFLRFVADIHLYEDSGARCRARDRVHQFRTVNRLPERDMRCERTHLVALQTTDEMPAR